MKNGVRFATLTLALATTIGLVSPYSATAAERIVLGEEFTATW